MHAVLLLLEDEEHCKRQSKLTLVDGIGFDRRTITGNVEVTTKLILEDE
jgi:hypothetical protein